MSEPHDPVIRLFSRLAEPEPQQALRERSLARAREAWERPAPDPWRRAWDSRPLRIAWAAAVILLVMANLALRVGSRIRPQTNAAAAASRERAGIKELQAVVELPRLRPHYFGVDVSQGRATGPQGPKVTTRERGMEDKS